MKKSMLFLTESFYPNTTPNAVCLMSVMEQLINDGYEIHVICPGSNESKEDFIYNGIHLHYIKPNLFLKMREYGEQHGGSFAGRICYKLAMMLNKIQKAVLLPWYPLNHPFTLFRFKRKAIQLIDKYNIDKVICTYCPLEATLASIELKDVMPNVSVGVYVLDSLVYMSGAGFLPKKVARKMQWNTEKKIYEKADMVFNMRCHEMHHKDSKYDAYRSKMQFLDIPLFKPTKYSEPCDASMFDQNNIQWTYMGTLFDNYREPYYMCRIAEKLQDDYPIQIQFFTRGSCEDKVAEMASKHPQQYVQHGYVSNDLKYQIYDSTDFLINIGVNSTTLISSKIFDYMAYGKPIIHFYYQDDDVNNPYLEHYPLCCMVQMKEDLFEDNVKKVKAFICNNCGLRVDSSSMKKLFKENNPSYTANAFESKW